jgi:poly(A) polymerase/tRNA nucleotidyltransferase (CCA-adding enzyme)
MLSTLRKTHLPSEILHTCSILEEAGYEAYLVGGCVRDLTLTKEPKDWDITTNANPEQIQALFPDSFYENTYGTVGVKTESADSRLAVIEVTPYRTEDAYTNSRHPDNVSFTSDIRHDLSRRDFTINAMAYRPNTGECIDMFHGEQDLANKVIRTVGDARERFREDALRILRALRFSAELNFTLASDTLLALHELAPSLAHISRERTRDEFCKLLMSNNPTQTLFIAQKVGVLKEVIPELEAGVGCTQNQAHSFNVFEHLLRTLQHAAESGYTLEMRIAALLHDIGKPTTKGINEKGVVTFYGHEVVGARMAKKICGDLRLSKEQTTYITTLIRWHMFFSDPSQITLSAVRRMIVNVGGEKNMWDLLNLRVCDRIGTGRPKAHPFRLRKYIAMVEEALRDPISAKQLKVTGSDIMQILGERGGPRVGWILSALLEEVLVDPSKNSESYLTERTTALGTMSDTDLKDLGESGKKTRDAAEAAELKLIKDKYNVS